MGEYDTSNIKVLTGLEAIRLRPGMYLGNTNLSGVLTLFYEVLEELIWFSSSTLNVVFEIKNEGQYCILVKNIDFEKFINRFQKGFVPSFDNGYNFGLECLIALSEKIDFRIDYDKHYFLESNDKEYKVIENGINKTDLHQITIDFLLNQKIFADFQFNFEAFLSKFQKIAYLNPKIEITLKNDATEKKDVIFLHFPNGISSEMDKTTGTFTHSKPIFRIDFFETIGEREYRISLCYSDCWVDKGLVKTYSDNEELSQGGSIQEGIYKGIKKALSQIAKQINNDPIKIAKVKEQLYAIAHVRYGEMCYAGSTKLKLNVKEVEQKVMELVYQKCLTMLNHDDFYRFFT